MSQDIDFDKLKAEQDQIDALINKGIDFEVPMPGGKKKVFTIHEPYLGTLDLLADEFIKMEIDEEKLQANPISESNRISERSSKRLARVVAIAYLNRRCWVKLPFLRGFYNNSLINRHADWFLFNVKPSVLANLTVVIRQLMNMGDFINSIRLLSGAIPRATNPKANLIEGKP